MSGGYIEISWELHKGEPHIYYCIARAPFGSWEHAGKIVYARERESLTLFDRHDRVLCTVKRKNRLWPLPVALAQGVVAAEARAAFSRWNG